MNKRAIIIVMDSVGIGELPDAADYSDKGAHTLGNIYNSEFKPNIPNLLAMGLGNIENSRMPSVSDPSCAYGKAAEKTAAKDTTSGHWELMGLLLSKPLRTFKDGFPAGFIKEFESRIGSKVLCNKPASGTQVIMEYGDQHKATKRPIVYTSADSVFQIAAHEEVIPLEQLYSICQIAREMLNGDMLVGRVIARPFLGDSGNYHRTENRKDFSIPPPGDTILDTLVARGLTTVGIGKIEDIFDFRGLSITNHTKNSDSSIQETIRCLKEDDFDFMFVNLIDFDMLYGHRNDVEGYAKALERLDVQLPGLLNSLAEQDLLIITADHGCDPTTAGTDHTREYVPILAAGNNVKPGACVGTRVSFADIGATAYEYLTGDRWTNGRSFLTQII